MIRIGLIASFAAALISLGAWFWLWRILPADAGLLPVHWGVNLEPNAYATRDQAVLMFGWLPGAGAIVTLLFCIIPFIDPLRENLRRSRAAYTTIWIGLQSILALVSVAVALITARAAGVNAPYDDFVLRGLVALGGLLVVLVGDMLPKTKPNFFLGVRTPWTLSSDLSWERTHRLTGRLMVLAGLWAMVGAFILNGAAMAYGLTAPILVTALIAVVYSFWVWRKDPDRRRPPQQA